MSSLSGGSELDGKNEIARRQQLYQMLTDYKTRFCHGRTDDFSEAFDTAAQVLMHQLRADSQTSQELNIPRLHVQPEHLRAEQPEIMGGANFPSTWTDELEIERPPELPDDYDDTPEESTAAHTDVAGPSTHSQTLVLVAVEANCANNGKATGLVSVTADEPLSPTPEFGGAPRLRTPHSMPVQSRASQAPPASDADQRQDIHLLQTESPPDVLGPPYALQARYQNITVLCSWLLLLLIPIQVSCASLSTYKKVTEPSAAYVGTLVGVLDFLLGILHNVALVALLIAMEARERRYTLSSNYLPRLQAMFVVFALIAVASIALQSLGEGVYAMLLVELSDSWLVLMLVVYFVYILRPANYANERHHRDT